MLGGEDSDGKRVLSTSEEIRMSEVCLIIVFRRKDWWN